MENRYLAPKPIASWRNIREGRYMDDLESFLADHVAGRDEWVQLKNLAERLTGSKQINNVCFVDDNRLIQVQDVSLEQLQKNMNAVSVWCENLSSEVPVDFMLAPNASWIYQDQLPSYTLTYDSVAAATMVEDILPNRVQFTNAFETLYAHRDEQVYFKSDHHWTMKGAAYAYDLLRQAWGLDADPFRYESTIMGHDFRGSTYSQAPIFGYPGEDFEVIMTPGLWATWEAETQGKNESGTILLEDAFKEKDQYTAFFGGNYGLVRVENPQAQQDKTLLVCKDSYANVLMPFLAEEYAHIVMIDLRYYHGGITALAEEADRVLMLYNLDFLCTDQNFIWLQQEVR